VTALEGTGIPVAGVANFPEGDIDIARAVADAREIVEADGTEVDVVFPWRALRDGQSGVGQELVEATRAAIGDKVTLKVILETGELSDPSLIGAAATESIAGGADFLKTSTGKTDHSDTPEAVRLLLQIAQSQSRPVGVKVSGGVRTVDDAAIYLLLAEEIFGADRVNSDLVRIGASSLLDDVLTALETG
jgi:deoxyribose-phosphate aldolase